MAGQGNKQWRGMACLVCLWVMVSASYGQSLGDVARQQRQRQQSKDTRGAKKVITDEDMPAHAGSAAAAEDASKKEKSKESSEASEKPKNGSASAEQWKARILAQKRVLADMQKQAERLAASIHFVDGNAYVNGPQYNQLQVRKQETLRQLEQQIEEEKTKLEDMQESARQAGFGNAVYDPE